MKLQIKICGLTDARGVTAAVDAGANLVGFVFFRRSPRYVSPEMAAELASLVPRGVKKVGLFVNPTDAELEKTLKAVRLDMIQLHGKETPARVDAVRMLSGLPVMKALGIETPKDLIDAKAYSEHADWLLFDAKPPKDATRPGGNARSFDWSLLKTYVGRTPWGLAGGLTRGNIAKALKESGARLVDVSSGVESRPGVKSPAKIRAFAKAARALKAS
ncbi:MAG: phosphoribosylanthranilate isomerase [Rhodospirillaceae bacterium]|nr:phosphoribosylanthranilate isomerase [Rhodospirillaceae bacterium]